MKVPTRDAHSKHVNHLPQTQKKNKKNDKLTSTKTSSELIAINLINVFKWET